MKRFASEVRSGRDDARTGSERVVIAFHDSLKFSRTDIIRESAYNVYRWLVLWRQKASEL